MGLSHVRCWMTCLNQDEVIISTIYIYNHCHLALLKPCVGCSVVRWYVTVLCSCPHTDLTELQEMFSCQL